MNKWTRTTKPHKIHIQILTDIDRYCCNDADDDCVVMMINKMGVVYVGVVEKDREGGVRRVNIRIFTEFRHI